MSIKKENVLHVSKLCKIDIEDNLERYYDEFTTIMESVDQILDVKITKEMLITPNQNKNRFYQEVKNSEVTDFFVDMENGYHVIKRSDK